MNRRRFDDTAEAYDVFLPAYKQGCDLRASMQVSRDDAEAWLKQAARYDECAAACRSLAELSAAGLVKIDTADTHSITIMSTIPLDFPYIQKVPE